MSFQACSGVWGWAYLYHTDLTMQENACLKNTGRNTPMCQRDLNWQTSLPAGKQNLQVQFMISDSNPKLTSVFTMQRPWGSTPSEIQDKQQGIDILNAFPECPKDERLFSSFLYAQLKNTHSFLSTDSVIAQGLFVPIAVKSLQHRLTLGCCQGFNGSFT